MSDSDVKRIAARADLCRLLAACYYEPGPEFAEERLFESMQAAAAEIGGGYVALVNALAAAFASQPLDALRVDYTRLFLNPGGPLAAPYESVWLAGKDPMGAEQATRSVLDSYRQEGFDVDDAFRDLPDHIAAELEFLYALVFREAGAAVSGDGAESAEMQAHRRAFVELHLGRWVGPFTEAMRQNGETGFYRALAALTERLVRAEAG